MKALFKVLVFSVFLTMFGVVSGFAQEPDLATLFEKFKTESKGPCGQREAAIPTGKLIIEKFGADELNKDVIDYVKKKVAEIEKDDPKCKRNNRYDASYKSKNWNDFFAVSKEIITAEGDSGLALDVMLTLVSVGHDRTVVDKIDTFNNDTMNYAKMAIQKIEAGKTSQTGKWGVFEPFKTKENALTWANYTIGFITYHRLKQEKEALPYFYKATQIGTEKKNDVTIYRIFGKYYFDEAAKLDEEYRKIRAANNNTDTDESKAKLALARGYADRGIDALGRAHKISIANKEKKEVVDAIYKSLSDLYKFRFNMAPDAKTPGQDAYVAGLISKPMPDPSTAVTPVVEEVKPTTTTTSTTTTPTTSPTTTATTTKPTTNGTTTPTTTTTTKTKTPVKKRVTKKKGTR